MAGRTAYGQGNAGMRSEPRGRMAAPGFDFAQAEADRIVAGGEPPLPPMMPRRDRPMGGDVNLAGSALSPRQSGFMPRPAFGGAMGGFSPYGFGRPPMGAGKGGYRPPMYGGGFGGQPSFGGGFNPYSAQRPMPVFQRPQQPMINMQTMYGQPQPFGGGRMAAPGFNTATGTFDNTGFGPVETATIVDPAPEPIVETGVIVDPPPEPMVRPDRFSGGIGSFGGTNQPTNPYSMGYGMGFRQQQPMGGGKGGSAGGKGGAR